VSWEGRGEENSITFASFTLRAGASVIVSHNFDEVARVGRQADNQRLRVGGPAQVEQRVSFLVLASPVLDLRKTKKEKKNTGQRELLEI
jgi:hypothetical protein